MRRRTFLGTALTVANASPVFAALREKRWDDAAEVLELATAAKQIEAAVLHVVQGDESFTRRFGKAIPFLVMTSHATHAETDVASCLAFPVPRPRPRDDIAVDQSRIAGLRNRGPRLVDGARRPGPRFRHPQRP